MFHPQPDTTTPRAPAGPVLERERILALDLLRGFAVLGILVMNIQAFSQVFAAYLKCPTEAYLTAHGENPPQPRANSSSRP